MNLQNEKHKDENMYIDSGATTHMTNFTCNLSKFKTYKGKDRIVVGNGSELGITHVGSTKISGLKINEMLVVPELKKNLISVSKITKDNACTIEFSDSDFVVKDKKTRMLLAKGSMKNKFYALEENNLQALTAIQSWKDSDSILHTRLGHPNLRSVKVLNSYKCINISSQNKNPTICASC